MPRFNGAVAVVTGGGGGIGAALVRALAAEGARVAVADISLDEATATAGALDGGARAYCCDVADSGALEDLAAEVERDFGGVNLVFANAGVWLAGALHETAQADFRFLFDVNVGGVFNTIRAFTPLLLRQAGQGALAHIVLTGSENSLGVPNIGVNSAYTATKHAVLAMGDTLRRDVKDSGMGVSVLCPGAVNTRIWDGRRARPDRYGGAAQVAAEAAKSVTAALAQNGQDPDLTARLCLEGVAEGEFLIIADPKIRDFAARRHREVEAALDRLDRRL
jgi:NAD(P)-dependent dehydrogenase (short-subunit alcohol dehydrogenase family)